MDIESQQAGISFAYQQGNSAIDVSRQKNADNSAELAYSSKQAQVIELERRDQTKVNYAEADNLGSENVEAALAEVSDFVQAKSQDLSFSFDSESNRSIIKVTDAGSGEVIRQIPSEEVLKLSERIKSLQSDVGETIGLGVLLNKEV